MKEALARYGSRVMRGAEAARRRERSRQGHLPTGLAGLDEQLGGGVPRGSLVELAGPASSGRTALGLRLLAESCARGELTACVDAFDAFDPPGARRCGVDLERLLWVRCASAAASRSLSRALKAADLLAKGGGFGAVLLDLEHPGLEEPKGLSIPYKTWFRLRRWVQATPMVMLVLSRRRLAGNAATLALSVERGPADWGLGRTKTSGKSHPRVLRGVQSEIEIMRGGSHGSAAFHRCF